MDSKLSRWCDGLIEVGWLAAIVATPLFFNIHSDRVFEPDKLTLLRSIAVLMAVAWLVKFIDQQGWNNLDWLRWKSPNAIWRMPLVLPVTLLVVVYLISTAISVTPRVSWAGSYQRLQGTYTTLSYITIFALAIATMRTRAQLGRVVTAVVVTSIPISFYGMLQRFELDPLPWGGNTVNRIAGHMGNSIFVAAYLIMAVPLTLSRIIDAFTSILNDEELAYADVVRSSIYIFTLAIQLIAIFWTQSRGPWIGLAVGVFTFILILLVSLRNADDTVERFNLVDALKAVLVIGVGTAVFYLILSAVLGAITESGRLTSIAGPMTSFVSFAGAVGMLVLVVFVLIAARRGWRWLWLAWMLLSFIVAGWLLAFNFSAELEDRFADTPVLGEVASTVTSWRDISGIGRLGRLLESESGTGRVRVLIWEGALDLIEPHEPLEFPDGSDDSYNFLRVLFGYGPESMYVAYNRFYPPELATVEARNASPDRAHNETFDALAITGVLGFLVWQALYLSIFYYAFRWLGVVRSKLDRNLLIGLWVGGAILFLIILTQTLGPEFLGVAIPFGSIAGLIVYLLYYALFARSGDDEDEADENRDPFQVDRLLMIGLVTAVLAHFVEIHFGIAIAATRIHFFMYAALVFMLGYRLQNLKEESASDAELRSRGRRRKRRELKDHELTGKWGPVLLYGLILALMIGILGYEFTTYSLPPDKEITQPSDLTTTEIFQQSFLINASDDFAESPFVFLMVLMTWGLGSLVMVSELVKSGELSFGSSLSRPLPPNRWQMAGGLFGAMAVVGIAVRFLLPGAEVPTTTALLGRSILLLWAVLSLYAAIRLFMQKEAAHTLAGLAAVIGSLGSFPALIGGGGWVAALMLLGSAAVLYLLWDSSWQKALLPAAVLGAVSLGVGLIYSFIHASALRSTLFAPQNAEVQTIVDLRVLEAVRSTSFLTLFYVFVVLFMLITAYFLAAGGMSKLRDAGSGPGFASLLVLLILGIVVVSQTNLRVIQADMIYKRGKPFDSQAARSGDPQIWDVAIGIYEKALELTPNEDFYYLFLGRAYLERSTITQEAAERDALLEEAESRLLQAQDVNPLNTDHTANLARLNTRRTQLVSDPAESETYLTEAEGYYQAALALSPQNSVIRNEYARLAYDLQQDCDKALQIYDESVEIDPYYEASWFGRADVYITCANEQAEDEQDQYYMEAAASLESALDLRPNNARAWLQLGQLRTETEAYEAAIAAYEEAKLKNTDNQLPPWNIDYIIATTYQQMDETELALTAARQAAATAPGEALDQVQALIAELSGEPVPEAPTVDPTETPPGTGETMEGERPLATIDPPARNAYFSQYPEFVINPANTYDATIVTEKGEVQLRLYADLAPLTVNNFVFLANQGFYDGTTFHRVLADFMAQGGDPTGTGGGGPGYQFEDETGNGLTFDRGGLLAMANAGPGTNGSQFFVTYEPTPWLDGNHTIFGEVIAGADVLDALTLRDPQQNPSFAGDRIERIEITEYSP